VTGWHRSGPARIAHVITTLDVGGAETMLWKLLSRMDSRRWSHTVFSLTTAGDVARQIEKLGVPVRPLGMLRSAPTPFPVLTLARELRRRQIELVQTWLYHGDLVGGVAATLAGRIPVIWNIRGHLDAIQGPRATRWVRTVAARCSRWMPAAIVSCSESDRRLHMDLGYDGSKMTVIPNGFDLQLFQPDAAARASVRTELGLPHEAPIVGLIARCDPQKDHRNFIDAAAAIGRRRPDVTFMLCGRDVTPMNPRLTEWINNAGLASSIRLLGQRHDLPRLNAALDVACSASAFGEGFSNSVGEAMASGVPCVVTDVSDSARLVGDTGLVVPPRDPGALATACLTLLENGERRRRLGAAARDRIRESFAIDRIVGQYEALYAAIVGAH
jgi:glycosyltransferase involved in cell wall biosynthesis